MLRAKVRAAVAQVGRALLRPEEFAVNFNAGRAVYDGWVWSALMLTAILGTATYGMTMGLLGGSASEILSKGLFCTLAAGLAWSIPLPSLYILNSLSGSRLSPASTLLAALVTTSWGGLAMIASIPINWFFTAAIPSPVFVLLVNLTVFAGVGISMIDVFHRVMLSLEPGREVTPTWWLLLVGAIGGELFYNFGLFQFTLGA